MEYFKYEEKYTDTNRFTLDMGNYKNSINKYLYKTDPTTGVNIYIVSVDLTDKDLKAFLKLQKVNLVSITKEEYTLYTQVSEEYQTERAMLRATKNNNSESLIVSYKGVNYDADEKSMYRISRLINLYNFKFNRLIANATTPSKAFEIYKETVEWKDAQNEYRKLSIEELGFILQLAIGKFENLWKSYD